MKSDKKKKIFISVLIAEAIIIIGLIIFAVFALNRKTAQNQTDSGAEGIFCSPTPEENIATDSYGISYANNELLVVSESGVTRESIDALAEKYDAETVGWIELTGDYQWRLNGVYTKEELLEKAGQISSEPEIHRVDINYANQADETAVDYDINCGAEWDIHDISGETWRSGQDGENYLNLININAIPAWGLLNQNKNIVSPVSIGLIECNGVAEQHTDLPFHSCFCNTDTKNTKHAAAVAGIMAANGHNDDGICGIYPYGEDRLYFASLGGIDSDEQTSRIFDMNDKTAFAYMFSQNVKVINCSYASTDSLYILDHAERTGDTETAQAFSDWFDEQADMLGDFLQRCLNISDFVIVPGAGNNSNQKNVKVKIEKETIKIGDTGDLDAANASILNHIKKEDYPDVYDRIIVAGAANLSRGRAYYSNNGSRVDVLAPGGNLDGNKKHGIYSTIPGNKYGWVGSGTSFAAPHVAGMAAVLWSLDNSLSGAQIKQLIIDSKQSDGIIDVEKGIRLVLEQNDPTGLLATEEDFAEFERMYDAAFDMTGAEKAVDFTSVDMNSLFEDWILNTWRYHGLYAYYGGLGDAPTDQLGIYLPRSAQSESEVGKFTAAPENSGKWIPWIVENVFGRKMDYSVRGDQFYYQDGQLYLQKQYFSGTGLPPYSDREIDNCLLSDGTYEISVTKTYSDGKKTWYYHAKPAYDDEHDLRYWKLLAISRNSFVGGNPNGTETGTTPGSGAEPESPNMPAEHSTDTAGHKETVSYSEIYAGVIGEFKDQYSSSGSNSYNNYCYIDLNNDGIQELIIHKGTCEQDRDYYFYTISDNKAVLLESVNGWHGSLHLKDNGELTVVSFAPGGEGSYFVTFQLENTELVTVDSGTVDLSMTDSEVFGQRLELSETY